MQPLDRWVGAWELVSFESRAPGGAVGYPFGRDPVGMIICSRSGHVSAQLGPRGGDERAYVAYFGTVETDGEESGTLTTRVTGGVSPRFRNDQVRRFAFEGEDELVLSPAPGPDGVEMILRWRRLPTA